LSSYRDQKHILFGNEYSNIQTWRIEYLIEDRLGVSLIRVLIIHAEVGRLDLKLGNDLENPLKANPQLSCRTRSNSRYRGAMFYVSHPPGRRAAAWFKMVPGLQVPAAIIGSYCVFHLLALFQLSQNHGTDTVRNHGTDTVQLGLGNGGPRHLG
jgi:hypothetical protein